MSWEVLKTRSLLSACSKSSEELEDIIKLKKSFSTDSFDNDEEIDANDIDTSSNVAVLSVWWSRLGVADIMKFLSAVKK